MRFAYLDQSTPELRERLCRRELALNRPVLPDIYLDVVPVTRAADGTLGLGGAGEPVEWLLHMRRFDESLVLDGIVARGELSDPMARELGLSVARYHAALAPVPVDDGAARLGEVVEELAQVLGELYPDGETATTVAELARDMRETLGRIAGTLDARGRGGWIRRCHGDLHLRNVVLHDGVPTPFDALEFDERMATTDILYDLAFLLMDLAHRGETHRANLVLNGWLPAFDADQLAGLAALPLFLACRAGIRAMTSVQAATLDPDSASTLHAAARDYLSLALRALNEGGPQLVAVGGPSGSGKSTVAEALAPELAPGIGAVLLRSDVERKASRGLAPTVRLPESAYTAEAGRHNHERLLRRARVALLAGASVVIDAVLLDETRRGSIERLARELGVPFRGLWLDAPEPVLAVRLAGRIGDASDADASVMRRQLATLGDVTGWRRIDAAGTRRHTLSEARVALLSP